MICVKYRWNWNSNHGSWEYKFLTDNYRNDVEYLNEHFQYKAREYGYSDMDGFRGWDFDILETSEIPKEVIIQKLQNLELITQHLEEEKKELSSLLKKQEI